MRELPGEKGSVRRPTRQRLPRCTLVPAHERPGLSSAQPPPAPLSERVQTTQTGAAPRGPRGYHPDFGGAAQFAVLGEHPAVVGQQHLEGVAHGDDEGHPQACAEDDAAGHVLHLAGHAAAAGTRRNTPQTRQPAEEAAGDRPAPPSPDASGAAGPGRGPGSGLSGEGSGILTQLLRCRHFSPHLEMNAIPPHPPALVIFKTNLG